MAKHLNLPPIASGRKPGELKLWDASTGREIRAFSGHLNRVMCVAFGPDGTRLVSGSGAFFGNREKQSPGEIKVWETQTGREILTLGGHHNSVFSVAFSRDGNRIVSGGDDNLVKVWTAPARDDGPESRP